MKGSIFLVKIAWSICEIQNKIIAIWRKNRSNRNWYFSRENDSVTILSCKMAWKLQRSFALLTLVNFMSHFTWFSNSVDGISIYAVVPTRNQLYNLFIIAWNIFESTLQRWIGWWTPPLILWMNNLWNVKRPIIQVIRCLMRPREQGLR